MYLPQHFLIQCERELSGNDDSVVDGETKENPDEAPNLEGIVDKGEGSRGRGGRGEEGGEVQVRRKPVQVGRRQQWNESV